ncbi:MAG TPA: type II secretion system protein GspN [Candidatus Binatia bacterium]|nr:type II secretion system protein GspN [Candidatus Binatia bacterium]
MTPRPSASERGPGRAWRAASALAAARLARRPRPIVGYAIFTAAVFVIALAYTLPHDLIARSALATGLAGAPVVATFEDVGFAFPNGYRFTGVRIAPLRAPDAAISIPELTVRTPLVGLLLGSPRSATLAGTAYGGTLAGEVSLRGARGAIDATIANVDLARALTAVVPPAARIAGRADVELHLTGDGRTLQSLEGTVRAAARDLDVRELAIRGFAAPELAFPEVTLAAQVNGGRLQVREARAASDAADIAATGDVLLRDPILQSVLNLRLTIDIRPGAPPPFRVAAALLPKRAAGEKPIYAVSGTLAGPVLR